MRKIIDPQLPLVPCRFEHDHVRELERMSRILDELPDAAMRVAVDLARKGIDLDRGREGMSAEQVLRAMILKQMNGFSYETLSFHLADSASYRTFCRFGITSKAPSKSTLQRNIKALRAETLEEINRLLVDHARREGIEDGRKVRTDCTVVEAAIHDPTDSSLLCDCVRVLTRLMRQAADQVAAVRFVDHQRRAKRRALAIQHAARNDARVPLYRDLLKVAEVTIVDARAAEQALVVGDSLMCRALELEIDRVVGLAERVLDQTRRRVLMGETVPAAQKIVSIFEPHTDIIIKDRRETLYGHKICLTTGASGLVLDMTVQSGNPADSTLAVTMIERLKTAFGRVPRQACFDGGFASKANVAAIKDIGVQDVAFSKGRGLAITDMVKSTWVYRRLRNFRAGVEGIISFLKRCFCLDRCTWSGWKSFQAFSWASVLAANLLIVARHSL